VENENQQTAFYKIQNGGRRDWEGRGRTGRSLHLTVELLTRRKLDKKQCNRISGWIKITSCQQTTMFGDVESKPPLSLLS